MEWSNMKPNTLNPDKTVKISDWDIWLYVHSSAWANL